MDRDTRSQSSCDTEKSLPVCHKRRQSSVSISNSSNSSPVKTQNHSTHHTRKRRRVSNDSRKDNDDDILKLDPIENCLSPYSNGSVSGQSQNSFGHNNSQNNSFGSNNHKNHNSFNNNNNNKDNFNKNYNNNNNNYKNNNNNNNFNNYNNKNNNYNYKNNNNNQNWYQKNQRYNNGNNNNTNRPFINYQQRINDLQDRLDQKEIQLKESKIDIMNRESDITELKIKHERELLEMEKNHCRKIKDMQLKEIEMIQSHKDDAIKMRLALDNKRDIIAKLRKDLEEAQKDSLVARAILETTNNRNVELTGRIAELLEMKKKNVSNKKIQTEFRSVNVEVQVDGLQSKVFQMSPPQSTVVNSTTRNDHQFNLSANLSDPMLNRNDSLDSGVSFARSESLASVESAHDPLDTTKSHHLLPNSCQKDIFRKLIYKKSPKNPTNHLTINIDGTKSDDYVMVDYIESPDEMPGKSLMDIREDLKEVSRDGFGGSEGVFAGGGSDVKSGKVQDDFGSLEMNSNRLKGSENDSRIEQRLKFGNDLEKAKKKLTVSSLLNLSQNSLNSIKKSKTDLLRSPDILKDFRDILESSPEPSKEPSKFNQNKSTEQSLNSHKITKNQKFSLDTSSESSQSSTTFESSSRNFEESTRNLLKKFNILHDSLDSDKPPDIFKSPQKTYEMSPKIHNIPPTYRDSPRSSCDLSGSADNLSINSELQDFLNLSESEPVEEPPNTVPISEADFYEFAQKFKEKLKQNKIQKAARDSLHIPIIPCYVNDIEKSNESAADSELLNNQNSNNNNEIENVQRSKVSTDDHKTTNYEKTDCSTDNESTNGATILPTVNSIKIEKDTDVSENDTDIDECHNAIVRSLIKRESGNESYDEISSISSHCTIGADDNVFRYEHNLSDKNVDDKNVGDKELRVGGNIGAENVSLICNGDKEGEKGGSEGLCGDGTEVNDGNLAEEVENIEKKSQNTINKDLKELEETIKILEGSSENLAAKEVKNEFLRQSEGNVENNLEEIHKFSGLSEDSSRPPEILPINDQFCSYSEDSGEDSTIQEKSVENLSVLGQNSSNCQSNSCNPSENLINVGYNLTQPLAIFMNPISNSFENLAENAQNLANSSPCHTNFETLSNSEENMPSFAENHKNSTSNHNNFSANPKNLSSNSKNLSSNHKNITSNYENFDNNDQNKTNLQESQTILTTNYENSNSSFEGYSNNDRGSTNSSLSLNLTSNYGSLPNLELNVANDSNLTSQFVDSGKMGQNTTTTSLSSEDLTKIDENTSKHLKLTSNSSEIEKVDQNTEISSNSEDLTKVGKDSSMSSKLPSNFEDFNKFGHDSSKLSNLNSNAQDLGHNSSIFTNLTSKSDNLEKIGQNLSKILNITSKSKNLTRYEQNAPNVSNLTSNLIDSVKIGQNTSISANLTSKSVNFSNFGQNSSNFSNLIFMSDSLEQNGQNSPKPLNTASISQNSTSNSQNSTSNSQNSTSNSQNSTLNSPTPLHTLPIPFRKKSYSPLSLKIQSHNATQPKIVQKIDENCPSYLHSFQDFLTERTTTVNNTQRKNGKASNVFEGLQLMPNSGSNVIIDNTRLLHQDQPRITQVGSNLTQICSNVMQSGSNFIQNDQKFPQTGQKFPQTCQKFPQTAQKFPQIDQKSKLQKDKLEQSQKEFQQKQKSIKIMKRRESILVDSYRVKRQKIETRSGSAAAQNDEMSKVVEKFQKFADMKASQSRMNENVDGSSSGVNLVENMNSKLRIETRSSENLFGFRKKKSVQDEGVKSAEFRVGDGQADKFEDLSKDSQIGMKFSTIVANSNTFETTKAVNQLINVVNDNQAAPNDDLLRSSSNQADLELNQENTIKTQVDSSLSSKYQKDIHIQLSEGPESTSGPQPQSHNSISSVPTPQTPSTPSNHLNSTEITQNSSSKTTNNSKIIPESSQPMTTPNITQMTNSVAHQLDSDSLQPPNSNEFDFNKITEPRRNSPSNSSVSSSTSREEFRSITPEYKGSPSSSLNDFGMSPVESFTKKRTSPSKKFTKNSPFKVDSKRPRNLPSEDEMGVCSQIVATTLKKSQQQREMSRSSEERMMQNGSFQGYSRNEQFYGFRNDRVDSGFNRDSQNGNNNSNYQGNQFQPRDERNRQDFGQESDPNRQNSMTMNRKPFDRSASLSTQDMSPKSPKYSRSNSYQEPQFKSNPKTPLTVPFRPISKEIQHIKNSEPTPSPSPPSDEQTMKRAQNKNDISQLVIAELTVFYELRKFESDNPKELFKSMARAITYHFHDKNPDYVPNKNVIKNYVMEVFYNYGTIRSEKDFLLSEEYGDDF